MASNSQKPELKLNLVVDTARRKVLFAEVGKDVADFLFCMLTLSVGDVVRLLAQQSMTMGCLDKLYKSVENLDDAYCMEGSRSKSYLLAPRVTSPVFSGDAAAPTWKKEEINSHPRKYYRCPSFPARCSGPSYLDDFGTSCPTCSTPMTTEMKYVPPLAHVKVEPMATSFGGFGAGEGGSVKVEPVKVEPMATSFGGFGAGEGGSVKVEPMATSSGGFGVGEGGSVKVEPMATSSGSFGVGEGVSVKVEQMATSFGGFGAGEGGFVKGEVMTYIVMDDLTIVAPMSTDYKITLLNKCNVKDMNLVEEMIVDMDMDKAWEMLKISSRSTTVLTDVLLPKKKKQSQVLPNKKKRSQAFP